jgi:hypothetical protein
LDYLNCKLFFDNFYMYQNLNFYTGKYQQETYFLELYQMKINFYINIPKKIIFLNFISS